MWTKFHANLVGHSTTGSGSVPLTYVAHTSGLSLTGTTLNDNGGILPQILLSLESVPVVSVMTESLDGEI